MIEKNKCLMITGSYMKFIFPCTKAKISYNAVMPTHLRIDYGRGSQPPVSNA